MLATNLKIKIHSTSKNQSRDHEHSSGSGMGPICLLAQREDVSGGSGAGGQASDITVVQAGGDGGLEEWDQGQKKELINIYMVDLAVRKETLVTGNWWLHMWWCHRGKHAPAWDRGSSAEAGGKAERQQGQRHWCWLLLSALCQEVPLPGGGWPLHILQASGPLPGLCSKEPKRECLPLSLQTSLPCQEQSVFCHLHDDPLMRLLCVLLTWIIKILL